MEFRPAVSSTTVNLPAALQPSGSFWLAGTTVGVTAQVLYNRQREGNNEKATFLVMRLLLAAFTTIGAILFTTRPIDAKPIWISCGTSEINLDSEKERFSLTHWGVAYQGNAIFSADQINFQFQSLVHRDGISGMKHVFVINRKTLDYKFTTLHRAIIGSTDSGWTQMSAAEAGKCSIMKSPPTKGNLI